MANNNIPITDLSELDAPQQEQKKQPAAPTAAELIAKSVSGSIGQIIQKKRGRPKKEPQAPQQPQEARPQPQQSKPQPQQPQRDVQTEQEAAVRLLAQTAQAFQIMPIDDIGILPREDGILLIAYDASAKPISAQRWSAFALGKLINALQKRL